MVCQIPTLGVDIEAVCAYQYAPPICTGVRAHPKELGIQYTGLLRRILFDVAEDVFVRTLKGIASIDGSLPATAAASNATTPRSKGALPAGIDTGISIMPYQTISEGIFRQATTPPQVAFEKSDLGALASEGIFQPTAHFPGCF